MTREFVRGFWISDESKIAVYVDGNSIALPFDLDFAVGCFELPDVIVEIDCDVFTGGWVLRYFRGNQNGGAITFIERVHPFVEQRFDLLPVRAGFVHAIHFQGGMLAHLTANLGTYGIQGNPTRHLVKPGRQDCVRREAIGLTRQFEENALGDFLREVRVRFPSRNIEAAIRRVAGLGYRSSRRGRRFESGLRNQMPKEGSN